MAEQTSIEWCDATFNPWIGCTRVSPACDDCYAARSTPARAMGITWGAGQPRRLTSTSNWAQPERWNRRPFLQCADCGWRGDAPGSVNGMAVCPVARCASLGLRIVRRRVFCASLADVFDNEVDPAWRADLFELIARTPALDWLLLTKRIGNAREMMEVASTPHRFGGGAWPLPNVWLGATVVNQAEADRDIPKLLAVPARVRFLSIEPMLGPINLTLDSLVCSPCSWCGDRSSDPDTGAVEHCRRCEWTGKSDEWGIDWVIAGGESGPKARPMHPQWARDLRDQCAAAGVPFLFKQWGEWTPGENVERQRGTVDTAFLWDDGWHVYPLNLATDGGHRDDQPDLYRVGKKAAGRLLDGRTHDGVPEVTHA